MVILETQSVSDCTMNERLLEAYRQERLSFLQYVRQATPYAGPADRPLLERVLALADAEAAGLDGFAEYLDEARVPVPFVGAFPTAFTNYNFIAIRKLLPDLIADEARGLAALEKDAAELPPGDARTWLEKIAEAKRLHLTELEKLVDKSGGTA
jgi:hypothetical protein